MARTHPRRKLVVIATLVAMGMLLGAALGLNRVLPGRADSFTLHGGTGSNEPVRATDQGAIEHPIFLSRPSGAPRIDSGLLDPLGAPVTISCASCHANMQPNRQIADAQELREFHLGLQFDHGGMTCLTCHNPENYNLLRLADGRDLEYSNVQTMCAQCHAPQARDFARGAHGGMTGYWDRTRGPQVRKNCIDCHDPHSPKFPAMVPQFKPIDRFLEPPH